MEDEISFLHTISVQDFKMLRDVNGWKPMSERQMVLELSHTTFLICAQMDGKTVGMARVIGSVYNMMVADVLVLPELHGKKLGSRMIEQVKAYAQSLLLPGESNMLNLMSIAGKEGFYEKMGFSRRPSGDLGAGMSLRLEGK